MNSTKISIQMWINLWCLSPLTFLNGRNFGESVLMNTSHNFQEYKEALERLRVAYFSNANDITTIRKANIDLMSAMNFVDSVLKNFVLQMKTNNKDTDKSRNRNTFLFRFNLFLLMDNQYQGRIYYWEYLFPNFFHQVRCAHWAEFEQFQTQYGFRWSCSWRWIMLHFSVSNFRWEWDQMLMFKLFRTFQLPFSRWI